MLEKNIKQADLKLHWIVTSLMLTPLIAYNIICYTLESEIQLNIAEDQRTFIRTILYLMVIILLPLVNLLRYILLKLNQTMRANISAKNRYLLTIIISMIFIEIIGFSGFVMFILGDGYNTLYIFSALAALGFFLHRPQKKEYSQIMAALSAQ